jgi:hypothetical protein
MNVSVCANCQYVETSIELRMIQRDESIQARIKLNSPVVILYAQSMREGVEFPPVRVWFDGASYWLSDGFHRVSAAERIGALQVLARVFQGSKDDARWDSLGANVAHGLRRTAADIRLVLERAAVHARGLQLSNSQLARHIGVAESTLRRWREQSSSHDGEDTIRMATRGGNTYAIETKRIGKTSHGISCRAKPIDKLRSEFSDVKRLASPGTSKVLKIVEAWVFEGGPTTVFLDRIEELFHDCIDCKLSH